MRYEKLCIPMKKNVEENICVRCFAYEDLQYDDMLRRNFAETKKRDTKNCAYLPMKKFGEEYLRTNICVRRFSIRRKAKTKFCSDEKT